jgi:hypothetical protein
MNLTLFKDRPDLRTAAIVAGLTLCLAACGSSSPMKASPDAQPVDTQPSDAQPMPSGGRVTQEFDNGVPRNVDVLFMVDDSPSMRPLQTKLAATFPVFVNVLAGLPGGLPNLHVAVVSSSLGAGPQSPFPRCRVGGDAGQFQTAPRVAGCTTGLPASEHFLSSVDGVMNFTGDMATAFSCMAQLGDQGCEFEHQFASVLKALEPGPSLPVTNEGFLRPEAYLAIILLTNEDDCSAPPDSNLFDTASQMVSDPLGPLTSFRCNEFGHLCDGKKPPRTPANLTGCTSAEDGRLLKISHVIDRTKALKNGAVEKILVSAIAGPPTPYDVVLTPGLLPNGTNENQPSIVHSCQQSDGTFGDPAVRIKMWVDAFKGTFVSVCDNTFEPAFVQIANGITAALGRQCFEGKLVDTDLNAAGRQPDCVVTDITKDDHGATVETNIPSCDKVSGAHPCWTPSFDPLACPFESGEVKTLINVARDGAPPSELRTRISCLVCEPVRQNPGCD